MIPRGKRKKRVGKERKKEREEQKGKTKKDPFLFPPFFLLQFFFFCNLDTYTLLHGLP